MWHLKKVSLIKIRNIMLKKILNKSLHIYVKRLEIYFGMLQE